MTVVLRLSHNQKNWGFCPLVSLHNRNSTLPELTSDSTNTLTSLPPLKTSGSAGGRCVFPLPRSPHHTAALISEDIISQIKTSALMLSHLVLLLSHYFCLFSVHICGNTRGKSFTYSDVRYHYCKIISHLEKRPKAD